MTQKHLSQMDRYVLARHLSGLETESLPASDAVRVLMSISIDTLRPALQQMDLLEKIFQVNPGAEPPSQDHPAGPSLIVPGLPSSAAFSSEEIEAASGVGRLLGDTLTWMRGRASMTSRIFLEGGVLFASAVLIARRLVLSLNFERIYPHLYVLAIAPTTYFHKSAGLRSVQDLLRHTAPHLLLPSQMTPEMLHFKLAGQRTPNYDSLPTSEQEKEDMARRFAAQRGVIVDEATRLLSPKKYLEGQSEAFLEYFDAPSSVERELRSEGKLIARNPALSFYGATTPALLKVYLSTEWDDGMLARFALLSPEEEAVIRQGATRGADVYFPPKDLIERFVRLYTRLPMPPEANREAQAIGQTDVAELEVAIDDDALAAFNRYGDALHMMTAPAASLDERLRGNYGRLPILALKVAMNLAAMDWADSAADGAPRITLNHWIRAQTIAESWRASAHRVCQTVMRSEDLIHEEMILRFLSQPRDRLPTERDILYSTNIQKRAAMRDALQALVTAGVVEGVIRQGRRGPSTTGYRLVDGD